jgi:hypothetical protein
MRRRIQTLLLQQVASGRADEGRMLTHVRTGLLGLVLPLLGAAGLAAEGWTQLKPGMTAAETRALLGPPLLFSEGHGFAVWIYDHATEVVFYDRVIAWTAPGARTSPAKADEAWSFYQAAPGSVNVPIPVRQRASRGQETYFIPTTGSAFRYQVRR